MNTLPGGILSESVVWASEHASPGGIFCISPGGGGADSDTGFSGVVSKSPVGPEGTVGIGAHENAGTSDIVCIGVETERAVGHTAPRIVIGVVIRRGSAYCDALPGDVTGPKARRTDFNASVGGVIGKEVRQSWASPHANIRCIISILP